MTSLGLIFCLFLPNGGEDQFASDPEIIPNEHADLSFLHRRWTTKTGPQLKKCVNFFSSLAGALLCTEAPLLPRSLGR